MSDARISSVTAELLRDCRLLLVGTKPYVPIGIGILTDFTKMVERIDAALSNGIAQAARVPKVRTSHHRNKEEAARLQELVARRCIIEECAAICDKHAGWGESKIRDDEPAESTGNQIFALISNTANDCAAMIRDLNKGLVVSSTHQPGPVCEHGAPKDACTICHMWSQVTSTHREAGK